MSYLDDSLVQGEQIVYRSGLNKIVWGWPITLGIIAIIFLLAKTVGVGVFLFIISIILGIITFLRLRTSEFGVTNKRVLIKVGIITVHSLDILITQVESIQVNQYLLGKMMNYGTITIRGTGGSHERFHNINAPLQFRKKVQEQTSKLTDSLKSVQN